MQNQFTTSDFYVAVFLRSAGVPFIGINKSDPRRFQFIFENSKDCQQLISDFFKENAKVEPRRFVATIKELKSLMYSDALSAEI